MTTSSRKGTTRNLIKFDGDEETKAFIKEYYGLPESLTDWKDIEDAAEKAQAVLNESRRERNER